MQLTGSFFYLIFYLDQLLLDFFLELIGQPNGLITQHGYGEAAVEVDSIFSKTTRTREKCRVSEFRGVSKK